MLKTFQLKLRILFIQQIDYEWLRVGFNVQHIDAVLHLMGIKVVVYDESMLNIPSSQNIAII